MLKRGETVAVFQMESGGMVNTCKQLEPDRIEDIIALIALYRPGPMNLIPDFIARKKGTQKVSYLHPLLEEISKETYGILIYQEQVHAGRQPSRRLHARRRRRAAPRDGQEEDGGDGRSSARSSSRAARRPTTSPTSARTTSSTCSRNSPATASTSRTPPPTASSPTAPPI